MPHDAAEHWHEPSGGKNAGLGKFGRPKMPYDLFMEAEGVPTYRAIGLRTVKELPLSPWKRLGGRGSYIQLLGTEGLAGMYVVEIPPGGALNVDHHLYEKMVLVIDGRGSTEVWQQGDMKKQTFEWQTGSMFSIPLNAYHRFVNATNSPALILCGTTAPNIFNLIDDPDFIFNCERNFSSRYSGEEDFFKPKDEIVPDPVRGLAQRRTNFIPDVINCDLPLDNRRSPGYRRIEPYMAKNRYYLWVGQHETGRYSKAHKHEAAAVLICLKGEGYSYTWPDALCGQTPWRDGLADKVMRQDYVMGGMVAAAPMSGAWFHQHFGVGREPLRLTAWHGANSAQARKPGLPGEATLDFGAIDLSKGGSAIPYHDEDPHIRHEFEATLAAKGLTSRMKPEFYVRANGMEEPGDIF